MKLWVFGHSSCLSFNFAPESLAWDDSVRCHLPEDSLIFYFSRDSHHNASPDSFFWLDCILNSGCQNNDPDMHPNAQGHMRLADIILGNSVGLDLPLNIIYNQQQLSTALTRRIHDHKV